jgi:hypothetical protein
VWVILRRFVADALELVATNAHDWRPDFILKLRITFHPLLAPALGLGILAGASASEPAGFPQNCM